MSSSLAELASQLLACADAALLDAPLDGLRARVDDDDAHDLLRAIHESGEASSLRDLLDEARLERWVAESATSREEDLLRAQIRRWLGAGPRGADDPERLAQVRPLPRDVDDILVWAREHELLGELSRPAREVLVDEDDVIPRRASLLACAIGQVKSERESLLAAHRVQDAARGHLMREAAAHAAFAARAALWARVLPEGPLRTLAERLRGCVAGTELVALHAVRFLPASPVRVDDERGVARGSIVGAAAPFGVKLRLAGHEQRAIEGECEQCTRGGCIHVRALAARLLDACLDEQDRLHATMRDLVAVPSWRRFLDAVAEPAASPSTSSASERLAFRVHVEGERVLVGVVAQRAQPDGGWTAGRLLSPLEATRSAACTDRDRRVLDVMTLATRTMRAQLVGADLALLRTLAEHPHVSRDGREGALRLVEHQVEVVLDELPGGVVPRVRLAGAVVAPGERHRDTTLLFHEERASGTLTYAALTAPLRRLLAALATFRGVLPPESYPALAPWVASIEQVARVSAPDVVRGSAREAPRTLLLRVVPGFDEGIDVTLAARALPMAPPWPPGQGPAIVHGLEDAVHVHARRDLAWEREVADRMIEALGLAEHMRLEPFAWRIPKTQDALELLSRAARLGGVLEIEWAERGRIPQPSASVRASDLDLQLRKKGSWLTVEGRVRVVVLGTELAVSRVLDAARRGERFVKVSGNDYVELERDLFERLERAQLCLLEGVKIPSAAIGAWEREVGAWTKPADETTRAWMERARTREADVELDPAWRVRLRSYQRDGVAWMIARSAWAPGVCLADDMGLGKTVQAIALLEARASLGPALVIAPTSVVDNWARELARFAPGLRVRRERDDAPLGPGDVVLTSYDLLLRNPTSSPFATQIVDEAQMIKNARTQRARAVASVDAAFRVALSGTPIENQLGDLWSLFSLIAPGMLGTWARFRARFVVPIQRYGNEERAALLRQLIAPFVLRRTKGEVAKELPSRTEVLHMIELSPAERALYDGAVHQARRALAGRGRDERTVRVLAEITRLRQLACHPQLVVEDERLESSKLHALVELLRDIVPRGHRVLVFSQFTRHLALVQRALDAAKISTLYLDGATPTGERTRRVDRFQKGEASVFLISLKAGGTGLNLTAADYVVHLDPWWNPAAEDQASDRAHRIGQERPITIVRLVAQGTIEERVLAMHDDKRKLAGAVITEGAPLGALDVDALESLIALT
ncbi:DEAD/DEAH box helicase [Sandaracinus amylolyticus]|uniref:Superfamily II DNA/RNA helicase n=1 Tax=Sandaracinus amylolyticus TaxID=927083 RepID=A0A0F6W9R8_9BACT|nr:DEAD/DEAH box helicase [Sandaracinus amylolyticus]AKF11023.1 Superfamily II DNA/RNA helicase [Sandaracinus amylolyticus]